ncbi:hypothetical protein OIU76_006066 [Salix suchowensis]|nr:hypothetical protein OIU76_006066 [Salix suchowensis]
MWLRNPLSRLSIHNESVDLEMSTDHFNGDPRSEINTGFYYIRSNSKTVSLFDAWYGRKDNSTSQKKSRMCSSSSWMRECLGDRAFMQGSWTQPSLVGFEKIAEILRQ